MATLVLLNLISHIVQEKRNSLYSDDRRRRQVEEAARQGGEVGREGCIPELVHIPQLVLCAILRKSQELSSC